ncbi:hypothetical protein [Bradyrhizobium sp. CCBAU 45384]|uniref:hypothetical protein n=1 Tax=Bradyrhizobium sp. CCBAU 45384 TaxID=858428 RepID=UPI002304E0A3|nr:hypothetical protein [Bradyrhizobium sp. CCBAU 45384]
MVRNLRTRRVRLLPIPQTLGRVVKIKPNGRGYYGFLHADGEARDYYFADRTVVNCDVPLLGGARVRSGMTAYARIGEHTALSRSKKAKSCAQTSSAAKVRPSTPKSQGRRCFAFIIPFCRAADTSALRMKPQFASLKTKNAE